MSLINKEEKKSSLIERTEDIKPENTFNRNSLFATNEPSNRSKTTNKKYKEKQTTLRVSETTSLEIKSLSLLSNMGNTNEVVSSLIDYYEGQLSVDEQQELKQIRKILKKKSN